MTDVPRELLDEVTRTPQGLQLCLRPPVRKEPSPTLVAALATTYACTAAAAALAGPLSLLSHSAVSAVGLGLAGRWRSPRVPRLCVTREGWAVDDARPQRPRWIQLVGDPFEDDEVRLLIDKRLVRSFPIGVELGCWTYANLDWLARELAEVMRIPLRDRRDPIRWRTWEHDQRRRVRQLLERRHARSSLELPHSFSEPAYEPRDLTLDMESMAFSVPSTRRRGRQMRISATEVTIDDRTYPMHAVVGVAVVAQRVNGEWRAQLQVGLYDAIYPIGTARTPSEVRVLRGIACFLERARSRRRRLDTGGFDDVPALLKDVRTQLEHIG